MVFSSLLFLFLFFPTFLLIYFALPDKYKNGVLCVFSLIFYAWGEPVYILLMIFSSVLDYINGRLIERSESKTFCKVILIESVIVNLSMLGFFKYTDFAINSLNKLFGLDIKLLGIALPIGISFFTFQTMSYTIDVYRGEVKAEKNFFTFMTYVCMFPQLIAGPIVRYETVSAELHSRKITFDKFYDGLIRFLHGLFKKVLIANNMGLLWNTVSQSDYSQISVATAWLASLAFTFQIYFDFSGYSDMAIGIGKMLGFTYPENFNYPLTATSVTDFWRRWHITLSTWFRDYVYIPLGGNRVGVPRHILNLMIVWGLTGLWHGAAVNFILWGLYYGILLILEKYVWGKLLDKAPAIVKHLYSLFIIVFGFTIFVFDDISRFWPYAAILFFASGNELINSGFFNVLINHLVILIFACILSAPVYVIIKKALSSVRTNIWMGIIKILQIVFYFSMYALSIAYLVNDSYNPFLYFRF